MCVHDRGVEALELGLGAGIIILGRRCEGLPSAQPAVQEPNGQGPETGIILWLLKQYIHYFGIDTTQNGHGFCRIACVEFWRFSSGKQPITTLEFVF
ncbi:hypothetical protein D3C81_2089590 [compost metagenome]